jgi:DNA-binding transcriptional ArsR family regulator
MFDWLRRKNKPQKAATRRKSRSKAKNKKKGTQQYRQIPQHKDLPETSKLVSNWKNAVEMVQDHPLSQARILNTQLLEVLTNVLESMDGKLDNLVKLDEIIALLKEGSKELKEKGVKSDKIEEAIKELERATVKDRDAYQVLFERGEMTADRLAKEMKISRSTASSRLNRMYDIGMVDKKAIGKKIYFSAKKIVDESESES